MVAVGNQSSFLELILMLLQLCFYHFICFMFCVFLTFFSLIIHLVNIKTLSFSHVININISNKIFYILFGTLFKSGVSFTFNVTLLFRIGTFQVLKSK
jgi:hypothetical protein